MSTTIATYETPDGASHSIEYVRVKARAVVVDRLIGGSIEGSTDERELCVAVLGEGEGLSQARAIVFGDGGYLERAKAARRRLCRYVEAEDRAGDEIGLSKAA